MSRKLFTGIAGRYRKKWCRCVREELAQLCWRIENEVADIRKIKEFALKRWEKALIDGDYLGSVAFDLDSFYQG
ncbi:MAG: hypothetical protein JRJ03_13785 [Deltaproteobacteria bacterium]|nr:hypothetical protein [Deltaproteobacteria bacterium]